MTANEAIRLIEATLEQFHESEIEAAIARHESAGHHSPVLAAQNDLQGFDDQVVFGDFDAALGDLKEFGECKGVAPSLWSPLDEDPHDFLVDALSMAGRIGDGRPVAYVGADSHFVLICEGAMPAQVSDATRSCLCSD